MRQLAVLSPLILLFSASRGQQLTAQQKSFQENNKRLVAEIFAGYDNEISPYNTKGSGVSYDKPTIDIGLQYARLIRVLEPEMQHQNLVGVMLTWRDPRLTWNPTDFGGIDHLFVTRDKIWFPGFYPCESTGAEPISKDYQLQIKLNSTGHTTIFYSYSAYFSCEFKSAKFPFDKQECYYCFILNNYDSEELSFRPYVTKHAYLYDTAEWSISCHNTMYQPDIDPDFNMGLLFFNITLSRRPQFWLGLVITPTFVIGSLILIGLFFGGATDMVNNAVGLGLATMMSMMVIVGILADSIAKSDTIPILGWYVIIEIVIITVAVVALLGQRAACAAYHSVIRRVCRVQEGEKDRLHLFKGWLEQVLTQFANSNVTIFVIFATFHIVNLVWLLSQADMGSHK